MKNLKIPFVKARRTSQEQYIGLSVRNTNTSRVQTLESFTKTRVHFGLDYTLFYGILQTTLHMRSTFYYLLLT